MKAAMAVIALLGMALAAVLLASSPGLSADPAVAREYMVRTQIAERGIADARVLAAMRFTPRERFVPLAMRALAFEDHPLPIGEGQTISQPYIVALMTERLDTRAGQRVLEVGTGSG